MLFAQAPDGSVHLVQRPPSGVWGGLWSPPEFASRADAERVIGHPSGFREGEPLLHVFTHFDLTIHPLWTSVEGAPGVAEQGGGMWYNAARPARVGLPKPVAELLKNPP
jgi:A/G-specific adenine glycosylase